MWPTEDAAYKCDLRRMQPSVWETAIVCRHGTHVILLNCNIGYFFVLSHNIVLLFSRNEEALGQETINTENVRGLKRKSLHENSFSPMQRFFKRHLSVTLLCDQSWCEMKTVYSLLKPFVKRKEMQRAEVQIGREIHLSRGEHWYTFEHSAT